MENTVNSNNLNSRHVVFKINTVHKDLTGTK